MSSKASIAQLIDFKEIPDGESWELFARDLLQSAGYYVESQPGRGADDGKDMIALETHRGHLGEHPFKWLVSCKHNAVAGSSVGIGNEPNLIERLRQHDADGFLGVYSTIPSQALNDRLDSLRTNRDIRDFLILDHRTIEARLLTQGFGALLQRYFPDSYRRVRPLHTIDDEYLPLLCARCGEDILEELYKADGHAIICHARRIPAEIEPGSPCEECEAVYWVHKGQCDEILEARWNRRDCAVTWEDISDLAIPGWFRRWNIVLMRQIRDGMVRYTDSAFEQEVYFIRAMAQKVYRDMTEQDRERLKSLWEMTDL